LDKSNPSLDTGSLASDLRTYYGLLYDKSWGSQSVVIYPEGTLVLQAVAVKKRHQVWEAVAIGVVRRAPTDKQVQERIHEAVAGMFKGFPEHAQPVIVKD
jgi:hypothetical protein